jgi:hypothetical protein
MGETITGATAYWFRVKTPSGTFVIWTPTIGTATAFHYVTATGDLDAPGAYIIEPHLTLGAWSGPAKPVKLVIRPAVA